MESEGPDGTSPGRTTALSPRRGSILVAASPHGRYAAEVRWGERISPGRNRGLAPSSASDDSDVGEMLAVQA